MAIDPVQERRIVDEILRRLELANDKESNDVRTLCVKTLGQLVRRVQRDALEDIASRLIRHLVDGPADLRCVFEARDTRAAVVWR